MLAVAPRMAAQCSTHMLLQSSLENKRVNSIISGFEKLGRGTWNAEVFQLGTGKNYSINELANMFEGEIKYIEKRPGEAWITLADVEDMTSATGWEPKVDLEEYIKGKLSQFVNVNS